MRKFALSGVVVAFAAASAFGQLGGYSPSGTSKTDYNEGVTGLTGGERAGLICNFPVNDIVSFDGQGAGGNTVVTLNVATCVGLPDNTPISMNGVGWVDIFLNADPNVGTFGGSWLSEIAVGFSADGDPLPDINLRVGIADAIPGPGGPYNSGGVVKFSTVPLPDIILPNGKLRMEFFESFDDEAGVADGEWVNGFLQIQVTPEPATMSLLALGGLVALRRRK